ncbi:chorismate-binding protein [Demequina sp.]|uniref:chorismate-binding protein n=1 Tax=Demequina sp. TaxID=2050685 RepID=UPI003A89110B
MEGPDGTALAASAQFRSVRARGVVEHIDAVRDGARLAQGGFWVVVGDFDGRVDAWRMAQVEHAEDGAFADGERLAGAPPWVGPPADSWVSSLSHAQYLRGVESIRAEIRDGEVYQVNLCRVLTAPLAAGERGPDAVALANTLAKGNPARYASRIVIPAGAGSEQAPPTWVVSASPELYLGVEGAQVRSSPIKGTAAPGSAMLDKDVAENVMITDLVRNDLSHVARPGSVGVPELLGEHAHPGLTHLESTVEVTLEQDFDWTEAMWPALWDGTFPPGSVSGAPKSSALRIIAREESAPRGPYCGAIGWIDADARRAELAVGIRTFWWKAGALHFGTGAGITWGSVPQGEWEETELKAQRLIGLASTEMMRS